MSLLGSGGGPHNAAGTNPAGAMSWRGGGMLQPVLMGAETGLGPINAHKEMFSLVCVHWTQSLPSLCPTASLAGVYE
eukprot:6430776-Amphidinium_carterae.1